MCADEGRSGSTHLTSLSVLDGTGRMVVPTKTVPTSISVEGVAIPATPLAPTPNFHISPTTRLIPEAWERLLTEAGLIEEYKHIPIGLAEGFRIGIENDQISETYIPNNYFNTDTEANIIREKFDDELRLGRLAGPFLVDKVQSFLGNFRTAPIAVIAQGLKNRIVIDHSYPHYLSHHLLASSSTSYNPPPDHLSDTTHDTSAPSSDTSTDTSTDTPTNPRTTSINSLIDPDDFRCDWGTFSDCFLLVANAPEGADLTLLCFHL
jgi:hypothetical protein